VKKITNYCFTYTKYNNIRKRKQSNYISCLHLKEHNERVSYGDNTLSTWYTRVSQTSLIHYINSLIKQIEQLN